jgi:hypothetical protein
MDRNRMPLPAALLAGADIPDPLVRAAGLRPVRADLSDLEPATLPEDAACLVFSSLSAASARAYHRRLAAARPGSVPLVFLDLPASGGPEAFRYAERRLRSFAARLAGITGVTVTDAALRSALAGAQAAAPGDGQSGAPGRRRAVLAGAGVTVPPGLDDRFDIAWAEGEHGYGHPLPLPADAGDPWQALVAAHLLRVRTSTRASLAERAQAVLSQAAAHGARDILLVSRDDDAAAWFRAILVRLAGDAFAVTDVPGGARQAPGAAAPAPARARPAAEERPRARKLLSCAAGFSDYQRAWYAGIRARVAAGEPFAVVNADAPQEILRALDVPFVVNQWWASIVAAKGGTARYRQALADAGLPPDRESYNSQGLAECFLDGDLPWGGLPRPGILQAVRGEDAVAGIFEEWAALTGAQLTLFDRTVESRQEFPVDWWDVLPHGWEEALEPERLDLMAGQLAASIPRLEARTGRTLDPGRLRQVLDLVNEQEEWYRRTRDLIARTRPAPVSIVDTIPATMIPQWHRGTPWGRDAARAFHDEVAARAAAGQAACAGERLRLMWAGRGLWQHMWLYQAFERSHGAVFVWSMYLGLAADGYLRYMRPGQDPVRALASRFVTVGDELRMPAWAAAWHAEEARRHGVDAVVAIDDAEPAVLAALEARGLPVLRLDAGNLATDAGGIRAAIDAFLTERFGRTEAWAPVPPR